jgi:hypothetical protein
MGLIGLWQESNRAASDPSPNEAYRLRIKKAKDYSMKILLSMLMLVMLVVVVAPASIGAQEVDGGLRFMSSPEEVMSVYTQLSGPNGKDVYATLSNSMRQDLWSLHLSRALLELNNLSIEQRAVILQGLGLLTRGVLSAEPKDLDWELRFGESLGYLEDQARDLLPRDVTSPDGSTDAIVTESGAGATTSYSYNIYLARRGSPRSEWGRSVVSLYAAVRNDHAYGVNVKWTGEETVVVECLRAGGVKIRRPTTEIQGREVHMTVKTGVVDAQAPSGSMAENAKASEQAS